MNTNTYLSPSEMYYRGELTREQARKQVMANARETRYSTGSPEFNRVLKFLGYALLPVFFLVSCFAPRRD